MKPNNPINQHWVPRFYLKHFSTIASKHTKTPQIWAFSKDDDGGDPILTSTKNVCSKRYLYSPLSKDGLRNFDLESKFSDFESLLARLWPQIAEDFIDLADSSIRKAMALFVATLILRHPSNQLAYQSIHKSIVALIENAPKDPSGNPDLAGLEINGTYFSFEHSEWPLYKNWGDLNFHDFFVEAIRSEAQPLAKLLIGKRWSVIVSDIPVFITSDCPVSKQHPDRNTFGFDTPGALITMPLSPTRLLVIDDNMQEPVNQYYPLGPHGAGPHNLLIWQGSTRMLCHRHPDEIMLEIQEACTKFDEEMLGR